MSPLRGVYPALQATFDERGEIDLPSMKRQVEANLAWGTHGLVFPVLGGELMYLADWERKRFIETIVDTAAGRVPVVAGVSAPATPIAIDLATHAAKAGADAVIALPAYPATPSAAEIKAYFRAIAEAAQIPVFVQHTGGGLNPRLIAEMLREIEWVQYVKEETPPSGHSISAILELVGKECLGVFGGAHGTWMITEMRRGATGFIPAAHVTDVYAQVWDAFQAGDEARAQTVFDSLHPMLTLLRLAGLGLCKEILVRRGVIATAKMRAPDSTPLDAYDLQDLDAALARMRPYMKA